MRRNIVYLNNIWTQKTNKTKTAIFDQDSNKVSETETVHAVDEENITNEQVTSFSNNNSN